ncbi:hypothetical protein KJA64_06890 [Xylella fastidiosa subsp. multiplex]|nr:hypothetical protein [Xylella fastidiosa]MBS9445974.1 hypothetical protein [Xylella fastidiosa subsp. multiplex]MBS9447969.1 hypothetical protein [Xylella fastidiosa subsp. multiplex]MBS9449943.1 hypothetical protein [Xylella fastidiosa subsp. multiplex]MBS9451896.1 hypothetical protein [Xylella fastidiosa subsp. multiplex]MBS9486167.1 hypothetical protein [Xylella fastidiosa subsp. multiplex]
MLAPMGSVSMAKGVRCGIGILHGTITGVLASIGVADTGVVVAQAARRSSNPDRTLSRVLFIVRLAHCVTPHQMRFALQCTDSHPQAVYPAAL